MKCQFSTFAILLLLAALPVADNILALSSPPKQKIVEIGLGVDSEELITETRQFIESFDDSVKFNFLLMDWRIVWHQDFLRFLAARGEIIPAFFYMQTLSQEERVRCVDRNLETFKWVLGFYPNGSFQFQPDTFTVNYLADRYGARYVCGYPFDQYLIDYMTMRGGWQFPYYASRNNVYVPSKDAGIVVLPHVTFDLVGRYTVDHRLNTHPLNALEVYGGDPKRALEYLTALIDETLQSTQPFGYVRIEFEYAWARRTGSIPFIREYYGRLLQRKDINFMTSSEVAAWFSQSFCTTPTYRIRFQSPATEERIEWYFSSSYRISRQDCLVNSFIDYSAQRPDKFLTQKASVDFSKGWAASNHIDTSLVFLVDALGEGVDNPPHKSGGIPYVGPIEDFRTSTGNLLLMSGVLGKTLTFAFKPMLLVSGGARWMLACLNPSIASASGSILVEESAPVLTEAVVTNIGIHNSKHWCRFAY